MVQQQVVRDRSTVFLTLSRLLSHKLELVRPLATLYTLTLVQAGDGETDPRNLLLLFTTKLRLLQSLEVRHHAEEVFESLAAYFPVDFTPPPGTVASVTKEQLQVALRAALCHPGLAEWTLGLVMEKLDSDLEAAKLDSLETLTQLASECEGVRGEVLATWLQQLEAVWAGLKAELLGVRLQSSSQLAERGGEAVTSISRLVGGAPGSGLDTTERAECWARWWRLVWADTRPVLAQPGTRLVASAGLVLARVIASGRAQAEVVLEQLLPVMTRMLDQAPASMEAAVRVVGQLLAAASDQQVEVSSEGEARPTLDTIFTRLLSSLQAGDSEAALWLARAARLWTDRQRGELATSLVAAVREGRGELGPALAQLVAVENRSRMESEVLRPLVSLATPASLETLAAVWAVPGLYSLTLPSLMEVLVTSEDTEARVRVVARLAAHRITAEDTATLEAAAPAAVTTLLTRVCPDWPPSHQEHMVTLLSSLASSLTVASWPPDLLGTSQEVSVYQASVVASVPGEVVASWPRDIVTRLAAADTDHCWRCLASVVNKRPNLAPVVDTATWPGLGWVAVGLVKRGDGSAGPWLARLVAALDTEAAAVAMVTRTLASPWWPHPSLGLLHKQRAWSQLLPLLSGAGASSRHVSALLLCLPHLPPPLLASSLPAVLPRVVSGLGQPDTCHAALTCLDTMMRRDTAAVAASHLTEVVHHCLAISCQPPSSSPGSSVECRVLALGVLAHCSQLEGATSVQLAAKVTRDLRTVLADRKRLVRLEAAKTRNRWFLVTQPS